MVKQQSTGQYKNGAACEFELISEMSILLIKTSECERDKNSSYPEDEQIQ